MQWALRPQGQGEAYLLAGSLAVSALAITSFQRTRVVCIVDVLLCFLGEVYAVLSEAKKPMEGWIQVQSHVSREDQILLHEMLFIGPEILIRQEWHHLVFLGIFTQSLHWKKGHIFTASAETVLGTVNAAWEMEGPWSWGVYYLRNVKNIYMPSLPCLLVSSRNSGLGG